MKNYANENELLILSQKKLISSFIIESETFIYPIFNFHLELGLECTIGTDFFSILLQNNSINAFSQWLMLEDKEMKTLHRSCSRIIEIFG